MTPEAIVSALILAVILLINVLGRLLGPRQEDEHNTANRLEQQRPLRQPPESRLVRPPQRRAPQERRIPPSPPRRRVAATRLTAARRLGVTEPRVLRRAVVLMTLLGPCRALDPDRGMIPRY